MVCCSKYNFRDHGSHFEFISCFTPAKHNQNRKKNYQPKQYKSQFHCDIRLFFAYIFINIDFTIFFLKTNDRICFLMPENIRIDILFMSLAYVVAKLAKMFIFIYVGGHLEFRHFGPLSRPIKKCNPFFLSS